MLKNRVLYQLAIMQFHSLKSYSEEMEDSIKSSAAKYREHLNEEAKSIDSFDDQFWEYGSDRLKELHIDYPNHLRSSLLITCITIVEKTLTNIHYDIKNETDINIVGLNSKKLKGSTINKVVTSIHSDEISLHELISSEEWKNLKFYIDIRNRVVHDAGLVHPKKHEELFGRIKQIESQGSGIVGLNTYHEITFSDKFSEKVISDCQTVLEQFTTVINNHFKSNPKPL
ncbi:hypothetical protein EBB07_28340 [Paenibacillaceae bacterium]|nr:hypothetical protein EBB07_28340 [Paenibacillaceae bacterium]